MKIITFNRLSKYLGLEDRIKKISHELHYDKFKNASEIKQIAESINEEIGNVILYSRNNKIYFIITDFSTYERNNYNYFEHNKLIECQKDLMGYYIDGGISIDKAQELYGINQYSDKILNRIIGEIESDIRESEYIAKKAEKDKNDIKVYGFTDDFIKDVAKIAKGDIIREDYEEPNKWDYKFCPDYDEYFDTIYITVLKKDDGFYIDSNKTNNLEVDFIKRLLQLQTLYIIEKEQYKEEHGEYVPYQDPWDF